MDNTQVISTRLELGLIEQIKRLPSFTTTSDFAKKAIEKELSSREDLIKTEQNIAEQLTQIVKNIDKLNTKNLDAKLSDLETKIQIIYTLLQQQTEMLKIIYRRTTFAANFAMYALDGVQKTPDFRQKEHAELIKIIEAELEKYN